MINRTSTYFLLTIAYFPNPFLSSSHTQSTELHRCHYQPESDSHCTKLYFSLIFLPHFQLKKKKKKTLKYERTNQDGFNNTTPTF